MRKLIASGMIMLIINSADVYSLNLDKNRNILKKSTNSTQPALYEARDTVENLSYKAETRSVETENELKHPLIDRFSGVTTKQKVGMLFGGYTALLFKEEEIILVFPEIYMCAPLMILTALVGAGIGYAIIRSPTDT